jgi:hypothetical protein
LEWSYEYFLQNAKFGDKIPHKTLSGWFAVGHMPHGELEDIIEIELTTSLHGLCSSGVEWCDYEITIYKGCYHVV